MSGREYEIRPFEGFGRIDFGMTPEEVEEVHEQHRGRGGFPLPTGGTRFSYPSHLMVHFDPSQRCMFIEVPTTTSEVVPIYEGIRLRGRMETALKKLAQRGLVVRNDDFRSTFDFDDIGITLWRESPGRRRIDSVAVWREDYRSKKWI